MMNFEDCIRNFLRKLCVNLDIYDADLELSYDADVLSAFINNITLKAPNNQYLEFILGIISRFIIDADIDLSDNSASYIKIQKVEIKFLSRHKETKYRIRDFAISSDVGAIIPTKYISDFELYNLTEIEKAEIERKFREIILNFGNSASQSEFNSFFKNFLKPSKNTVLAIYNNTNYSFVKLYSKCYFIYLLKGNKTIFPQEIKHNYSVKTILINSVNTSNEDFTQFFEIYDVMDEYHHASDILVKYLKIYQVIEYLITRTILVKIQANSSKQNLFLREMTSLSKLEDFNKDNFRKVFRNNENDLGTWFQSKLDSSPSMKLSVEQILYPNEIKVIDTNNLNQVYNSLLALIYKLRNTIVHNKESELHLTIHNIKLKQDIVKLIKDLLQKLETVIFKKVVDFEEVIKYKDRNIALY